MPKYNKETGKKYLLDCDFLSLSDYLYSSTPENPTNRRKMDEDAAYFRKLGEYATTMFDRSDNKERTALYFQNITGTYNPNNKYIKQLYDAISNIKLKDGRSTNKFVYAFDDDNAYNKFASSFSEDKYDSFVSHVYDTGKHYVTVDKGIFYRDLNKATDLMNALSNIYTYDVHDESNVNKDVRKSIWGETYQEDYDTHTRRKGTPWSVTNPNAKASIWSKKPVATKRYNYKTINAVQLPNGTLQYNDAFEGNDPRVSNAMATFATALAAEKLKMASYDILPRVNEIKEGDTTSLTNLVFTGYMCEAEAKLKKAKLNRTVDKEYANDILKDIDDYYKHILYNVDLNNPQYSEVYASDINGETTTLKSVGTEDNQRTILNQLIRQGLDHNRISYVSAMGGGRSGTYITISPDVDTEGKPIGNLKAGVTIFVPGLFEEDIAKVQSNNSGIKAFQEYNDRIKYNYNYTTATDGTISDFNDYNAKITKDGVSKTYSREDIQRIMEKDILLRNASRAIQRSTVNDKGEYIGITNKTKDMAKVSATNIAESLYGNLKDLYPAEFEAEYQKIFRYFQSLLDYSLN